MKKVFFLLLLSCIAVGAMAQSLFRTVPILQNPTKSGITVTWLTTVPTFSYVEYGTDCKNLKRAVTMVDGQIIAGNTIHKIRLENLQKGQKYFYRIVSKEITLYQAYKKEFGDSLSSDFYEFTYPKDNENFTAVVFNDLHKQKSTVDLLAASLEGTKYDLVIFNGDCIDDPKDEDDAVSFLSYLSEKIGKGSSPMIFTRGNHEIRNAYSIRLRDIIEYSTEKSYGSFNWGDTRFVVLDCGEDKPDAHPVYYGLNDFEGFRKEQVDFLKRELKSKEFKTATKRILVHHIPIYGDKTDEYNPCHALWHPELKNAPFNVCLNAHTHSSAFYKKGEVGENNFPIIIGGGP
ncbi:MAG: FN3 domain-containing metallophosphoesterase family protein, partial [Rikenellaceae bacterium]